MNEETQVLDTLIEGEGDTTIGEDITTDVSAELAKAELAKARELAENQRIRAEKAEAKLKARKEVPPTIEPDAVRNQVREELENAYLEELEYPEDIKAEIKKVAKMNGLTIRQAEKDPYIAYKIDQAVQENRINEASIRSVRKTVPKETTTFLDPKKFDLNTEEGRKAWTEAKAKRAQK
jgi:hypothetical protein